MLKKLTLIILSLFCFNNIALANNSDLNNPQSYTRTLLPEINKDIIRSNADCRVVITNFEFAYFSDDLEVTLAEPATPEEPAVEAATPAKEGTPADPTTPTVNQGNTIPSIELGTIERFSAALKVLNDVLKQNESIAGIKLNDAEITRNDVLGCALVTGRISFMYLSIFVSYALNMMAIIAGSVSMLFIIIGGYQYIIGSLTQNTDDAKKTITNAIIGLILSTAAWIIVNIVLAIVSS